MRTRADIPEKTKIPLQREGLDPVSRIAEIRKSTPMHRLDLPFNFNIYLVTAYEESRRLQNDLVCDG